MPIKRIKQTQRKFNSRVKVNSNSNLNKRMVRSVRLVSLTKIKRRNNNMENVCAIPLENMLVIKEDKVQEFLGQKRNPEAKKRILEKALRFNKRMNK